MDDRQLSPVPGALKKSRQQYAWDNYEQRLATARTVWKTQGDKSKIAKPPVFNPASVSDDDIWDAYRDEHYGDAALVRRMCHGLWLRDALLAKGGEGGDFYFWDGCCWRLDIYNCLYDYIKPLGALYERLLAVPQGKLEDLAKERDEAKARLAAAKKGDKDYNEMARASADIERLNNEIKGLQDSIKPIKRRAASCRQRPRLKHIIAMAFSGPELQVDGLSWNKEATLLPCLNGTIDLERGVLVESRPEHYFSHICPVEFHGLDAPCPHFMAMVNKLMCDDQELYDYFLYTLGMALTGRQTKEIFFCLGPKADNGKSTIFSLMFKILGASPDGFAVDFKVQHYLYAGPQEGEKPEPGLLQLVGARIAISGEPGDRDQLDLHKVKTLTSETDGVNTRTLNSARMIRFVPTHTPFIHCNKIPSCNGGDQGLRSRARIIPFMARFLQERDLPGGQEDPDSHLYLARPANEIMAEMEGELPGILGLLVQHAMMFLAGWRCPEPAVVADLVKDYLFENDLGAQFLEARTRKRVGSTVVSSVLYDAFVDWAINTMNYAKAKVPSQTAFGKMLKPHLNKRKSGGVMVYDDVEILPEGGVAPDTALSLDGRERLYS